MRILIPAAFLAAALGLAAPAAAQTCTNPSVLVSNGTGWSVDNTTCGQANSITTLGGYAPSPQPDFVYSFVAGPEYKRAWVDGGAGPLIPGLYVLDACSDSGQMLASATASGAGGGQLSIDLTTIGLTAGNTYYLVVSSAFYSNVPTDNCGHYTGYIGSTLPVTLQKFSVD